MDLLNTVRKEGSRGGTGAFKWEDVQNSSHRDHYLGHSLNAPVGRWQKGRDLNWYAKAGNDEEGNAEQAAQERAEEIRKVKEAEQDAMAKALGLPVPDRSNPNTEALGTKRNLEKLVKEGTDADMGGGGSRGVGFGGSGNASRGPIEDEVERLEGNAEQQDQELQYALREHRRRHREHKEPTRTRSRDYHRHSKYRRHRSRSRESIHHRKRRSRSRDSYDERRRPKPRDDERHTHRTSRRDDRSYSPRPRRKARDHHVRRQA